MFEVGIAQGIHVLTQFRGPHYHFQIGYESIASHNELLFAGAYAVQLLFTINCITTNPPFHFSLTISSLS